MAAGGAVSAFKPVVGGGQLGVVGRPLPPAPRPQVPRLDPPPQPPQPAAQPNKRYNPASVYGGGPRKDSDERLEMQPHLQIQEIAKDKASNG